MKNKFRLCIGLIVATPFALIYHIISLFIGKQKTVTFLGPWMTIFAKSLQQFFPPKIYDASEFELFKSKLKDKQRLWSILYDYPIEYPDDDTAKLNIINCPFAEAINKLKISEFGHYICQGDWEVAKKNSEKWLFERSCTIATGGTICDFTYKRVKHN